ncbi:MAG TPA: GNAT family N-acetyltransferase [Lachnospiraceae bacterium]|uniref:GNAT family N-acetyltransferase n=1 Tax=Anaerosporobacter sp. TaxID=1872529 RepID=UPI000ED67710|nr:GNAT family N-acetyltransferase [Anaerosporobacter sp.]HAB61429.1 GNAT family N-acetyltransferase [Lachnospiraceae bacterium]
MNTRFHKVKEQEEINVVAELGTKIWHEHYSSILEPAQIDYMVDKFQSANAVALQINDQGYEYYLIKDEESVVGYIGLVMETDRVFLSKLYIAKEARGKGLASKAFAFITELATSNKKQAIWLTVNRYNSGSIAVYEKKGFIKVREQVSDIGNGYVMDDYVMELVV